MVVNNKFFLEIEFLNYKVELDSLTELNTELERLKIFDNLIIIHLSAKHTFVVTVDPFKKLKVKVKECIKEYNDALSILLSHRWDGDTSIFDKELMKDKNFLSQLARLR